jgi:hypothetical protein
MYQTNLCKFYYMIQTFLREAILLINKFIIIFLCENINIYYLHIFIYELWSMRGI